MHSIYYDMVEGELQIQFLKKHGDFSIWRLLPRLPLVVVVVGLFAVPRSANILRLEFDEMV